MVNTEIRLITFSAAQDRETLYTQQKQDSELTVAQIMNSLLPNSDKLKKVGKTSRPFRYDLNQTPYDYTAEVINRDLIWQSAWRTMDGGLWHCTGGGNQDHPQEKEMQKGKMVVWGGLGLPWYWMVCLGNEQRSFCHFWDFILVLHFRLFCWLWWLLHFF